LRSRWLGEEGEGWKASLGQERIYVILQDQVSEAKLFFERMPSAKELLTLQIPLSFDRSREIQPCVPAFIKKLNIWLPLSKWLS
jgi:hypothetical protein